MKNVVPILKRLFFTGPVPLAALVGVVLVTVSVVVLFIKRNPTILGLGSGTNTQTAAAGASEGEIKALVEKVGRLALLPPDETPTVATVSDISQIKDQKFFQNAQNGDKVLFYHKAQKAYLYRPTIDRLIEMSPANIASTQQASGSGTVAGTTVVQPATSSAGIPSPTPSKEAVLSPKVVLYNGTATTGLTRRYETELKAKVPSVVVVDRDNAKKKDYDATILIDIAGNRKTAAQSLASVLGITVADMPIGESATSAAEFLIILGADKVK